jgi:acyl carrier protein
MNEQKIKSIMSTILKISEDEIHAESSPDNIKTWDSLQHMNLILGLEQSFGITFDDEEIIQLLSYEIILAIINEKVQ